MAGFTRHLYYHRKERSLIYHRVVIPVTEMFLILLYYFTFSVLLNMYFVEIFCTAAWAIWKCRKDRIFNIFNSFVPSVAGWLAKFILCIRAQSCRFSARAKEALKGLVGLPRLGS